MKNKVLINLYVPNLDKSYDLFIPTNEFIWKINKLVTKSVSDLSEQKLSIDKKYGNNEIVVSTDIRNSTKLVLMEI